MIRKRLGWQRTSHIHHHRHHQLHSWYQRKQLVVQQWIRRRKYST
jgi:hypothetical protein